MMIAMTVLIVFIEDMLRWWSDLLDERFTLDIPELA
jgi:hypothetical protein